MTIRNQSAFLVIGTAVWLVAISFVSGLIPTSPLPELTFIAGLILGLCAVALVPSGAVALVSFLVSRRAQKAMRLWALLASLSAIFLALGCFALKDNGVM